MTKELFKVETYDFYEDRDFQAFLKVKMPVTCAIWKDGRAV